MQNILVTGGAGAVGTNLIEKLLELGNKVTSWDNYSAGKESNHLEGATYIKKDTRQTDFGDFDEFDLVYHLGEYSKIHPSFDIPETVFRYNMEGSMRILEVAAKSNTPVVYSGSSTKLSYPGEMGSPYAFFKSNVAKLFEAYGQWYRLKYNICYFYNAYGPRTETWGNEWQTVINIFRDQKKAGKPLTIAGDGKQERDFTHVYDIVQGLILAGKEMYNEEFQLGTGRSYSIEEIAAAFKHEYTYIEARKGERRKGVASIESTKKRLGYEPKYNVIEYIEQCR